MISTFSTKEKQLLFSVLGFVHEVIEQGQEINQDVMFVNLGNREETLSLIISIGTKIFLLKNEDEEKVDIEQLKEFFIRDVTKEEIKKILRGG